MQTGGVTQVPTDVVPPAALVPAAVALARRWLAATQTGESRSERAATERLRALVADPAGLELAVRFVDRVARPDDPVVAARELARLETSATSFLGPADRALLALGSRLAPAAPRLVVPLARRRLRRLVGHLVLDDRALGGHLARAAGRGVRVNVNLLGEAVLGEREARARAARTAALLARGDVDHVSVKVSSVVSQIAAWDTAGEAARVARRLRPLYEAAARRRPAAFVTLDMEEYRDVDLTIEALRRVLADPALARLEAGIALQAYLPDTLHTFERVLHLARRRCERGGARLKVRLVKGANLAMERVEAERHRWVPAPFATKAEVDASYVRLLDVALRPDVTGALRVGVASHNVFDVALAHLLARARGVSEALDVEMLHGMAPAQARAVHRDVASLVEYTPVAARRDFAVAVAYLVRRLEESAAPENVVRALTAGGAALAEQEQRFVRSVADLARVSAEARRSLPRPPGASTSTSTTAFANAPDTDPATPESRARALAALGAPPMAPSATELTDAADVDAAVERALTAGRAWAAADDDVRADVLRRAAEHVEARREELWTAMVHEGGKTIGEADPEVSEAVDYARYYAGRAAALGRVDGARLRPVALTLVTPPWNFPVAIPAGSTFAALAAGSAVLLKPAPQTPVCAEVMAAAVRAALAERGFDPDVLTVVRVDEASTGRALVRHRAIGAIILTGSVETARLFARWRPDVRLIAETSGKNAIVVTPAADPDLAVADVVHSAFGHAGQKCSAASLVIAVGSVATSERFRRQLVDAVASVRAAWPEDPGAGMGPLVERPSGKLLRALTTLDEGERWLVRPRPLDGSGRLWSPGLKEGVAPGSFFHRTECFGPVLGLMRARTLDEAIALQNATPYGLTGGIHSLDEAEIEHWLDRVEVGNAYVNRHVTGAVVGRQPFGGWRASAVGPGAKAGGPDYVAQLGVWEEAGEPVRLARPPDRVALALETLLPLLPEPADDDAAWLRRAVASDAFAWVDELGREHDPAGLVAESNVLRYRPLPALTVRAEAGARWRDVLRTLLAATLVGTRVHLSIAPAIAADLPEAWGSVALTARRALAAHGLRVETADACAARLAPVPGERIRVVGEPTTALRRTVAAAGAALLTGPVLAAGRRELLGLLREQTVSRSRHRFGHVEPGRGTLPA